MALNKKFDAGNLMDDATNKIEPVIEEKPEAEKAAPAKAKDPVKKSTSRKAQNSPKKTPATNKATSNAKPAQKTVEEPKTDVKQVEGAFERQTYYISRTHIGAIDEISHREMKEKSAILREFIDAGIKAYKKKYPDIEDVAKERGEKWTPGKRK